MLQSFKDGPARRGARKLHHVEPVWSLYCVGFLLIGVIWLGGARLLEVERHSVHRDAAIDTANLALVVEQSFVRTASELDRILLFLRRSKERQLGRVTWQDLVKEDYTINDQTVQIAVMDSRGLMLTSTAMLHPSKPIDLSDREHFRFHADASSDQLYISRPMIGRASGKWSVQFARRLTAPDGTFDGVVVVSLDPDLVMKPYNHLELGKGGGVALVGHDGVIRAGTGLFRNRLGGPYVDGLRVGGFDVAVPGAMLSRQRIEDRVKTVASRVVSGYPLTIFVVGATPEENPSWSNKQRWYLAGGLVVSLLVVSTVIAASIGHRQHQVRLVQVAQHDPLTGLPNRLMFQHELESAFHEIQEQGPFALLLIDLDNFKPVNDAYGHPIGDRVLSAVAGRLQNVCRAKDIAARLGGDEFAILQTDIHTGSNAETLSERVRAVLSEPYDIDGLRIVIGATIGIAVGGSDGASPSDLVNAADLALYCAKTDGRGTCRVYNSDMSKALRQRRALEEDLRAALERGELELHYQPVTDVRSMSIVGFEALTRWRHREHGWISPAQFIPIAEEAGLIEALGVWVVRQACRDAATWPEHLKVAVNCSPIQLKSGALAGVLERALQDAGLRPERLELEITESTLMQRDSMTTQQLQAVRALGIGIAMDDFGTGYSSLSYLHSYPIGAIKIDRSFVQTLGTGEGPAAIIAAIVALAQALGMRTVAEGVETSDQLEALRALGCTQVQGYLLGRPMPADATASLCRAKQAELPQAA